MSLASYKKKRSFDNTPEPAGKKHSGENALRFVIQKHQASHLHYDFRLEMEGVLKSWAVPKGPSINPADKRLAMMVEDHPFEYREFEGIIPEGNYGAGTVIIWDEGTYEPIGGTGSARDMEKQLLSMLRKGDLKLHLKGKKIKGDFALVKIKSSEQENAWLLIKKADRHAGESDITKKDKSVVSKKTLEQVAATSNKEWKSNRKSTTKKNSKPAVKKAARKAKTVQVPQQAKKSALPAKAVPMLATLVDEPFDDKDWLFEVKWDGYRALAYKKEKTLELLSRNKLSYNKKFHPIASALELLDHDFVMDGEIIALNEKGNSDFQLLQAWQKTGKGELAYYAFDLLWLDGHDLRTLPLTERKQILFELIDQNTVIKYSDHVVERGKDFYELAQKAGLEGIIAKKADSEYHFGVRTRSWLKVKTQQRQEAVIAGYTRGRGSRKHFGALVLGIYDGNEFRYIGHSGSGFDQKMLAGLHEKLEKIRTDTMPFKQKPKTNMPVEWVKPQLVCEVKFQEWTRDNMMRHPIFLGLREDKNPKAVGRENAKDTDAILEEAEPKTAQKKAKKTGRKKSLAGSTTKAKESGSIKSGKMIAPFDADQKKVEITMGTRPITFTNLGKIYWKKEKYTKADLLNYYREISPYILPYMTDRPQSLNRHPDGADGKNFYQKNVTGKVPDWVKKHRHKSDNDGKVSQYFVCTDEASLLYMANLGCIEMNPWHSRVQSPDNPDWCVIDLDPGEIGFDKVIEAAGVVKEVLDSLGVPSYCKTSGSTGLHIYIPLGAKYDYDQSRQLAELVVTFVHDQIPAFTSLERSPAKRKKKIYLDYLQNRTIQTIAAPYSLRPKPGATVSTPLHWDEVRKGLKMGDFTIRNIFDRLKETGDIFGGVLGKGIDLEKTLEAAAGLTS